MSPSPCRAVAVTRDLWDSAVSALHAAVGNLRDTFRGVYGAGNLKAIGFAGNTPRQALALLRCVGSVMHACRKDTAQ